MALLQKMTSNLRHPMGLRHPVRVPRLLHTGHDSFIYAMTHSYVPCLIHMCHDSFICAMTHPYVQWHICAMTHPYVPCLHDSFICVMAHSYKCAMRAQCVRVNGCEISQAKKCGQTQKKCMWDQSKNAYEQKIACEKNYVWVKCKISQMRVRSHKCVRDQW